MTVTEIRKEKKHLVKVIFSGGESLLLDSDFCKEKCIREGDDISPDKVKEYRQESDYIRAKSRALWLLDRYEYSEQRLYEKLKSAGFGGTASAKAISRLKELGLLDDTALCTRYAEYCENHGISKREAYYKLLSKGFTSQTVKSVLDSTDFDESEQISSLIERKYGLKLAAGETQKVYAALVRKGFSYSAVRDALKKYSEELETDEDI